MRKWLACVPTALVLLAATPASAEPAVVTFTEGDRTRVARIPDDGALGAACPAPTAVPADARRVDLQLTSGGRTRTAPAALAGDVVLLLASSDASTGCVAPAEVGRAIREASAVSDARAPWLALVLAFGGLAAGVLLIVAWGAGRGPEATLRRPYPEPDAHGEEHDHDQAGAARSE